MARRPPIARPSSASVSSAERAETSSPTTSLQRRAVLVRAGILLIAVVVAYGPSLVGGFVWDDRQMIPENPLITRDDGLWRIWTSTVQPDYWPLAYTTHWVEWRLFGRDVIGYRIINLLLHVACALAVWGVLNQLGVRGGWWCALVFALHPVNVEAVAWILQRKTTLSTLCALAALTSYLRFDRSGRWPWYVLATLFFVAGLLVKTAVVMLPVAMLLVLGVRGAPDWRRRAAWALTSWLGVALFFGLVGVWFQRYGAGAGELVRDDSLASRVAIAGRAVWFYLGKALWPADLSFVYPRWPTGETNALSYLPLVLLIAAAAAVWLLRGKLGRGVPAALGWYVIQLVPALGLSNIYFMRYSLVADHWQYLALPGLVAVVVAGSAAWTDRRGWRAAHALAWSVLAGVLGWLTWSQAHIYADNSALWRDTINHNPSAWIAHHNLGVELYQLGRLVEARDACRQAVELAPQEPELHNYLGVLYKDLGELALSESELRRAIELNPELAPQHDNLATTLMLGGRLAEAETEYRQAIALDPNFAAAHNNLGLCYEAQSRLQQAANEYQLALELRPDNLKYLLNRGRIAQRQGRWREALSDFEQVRRAGGFMQADLNWAWLKVACPEQSLRDGKQALLVANDLCQRSQRQYAPALDLLAAAYAELGDFPRAVAIGEEALAIAQNDEEHSQIDARVALYRQQRPYRFSAQAERPANTGSTDK